MTHSLTSPKAKPPRSPHLYIQDTWKERREAATFNFDFVFKENVAPEMQEGVRIWYRCHFVVAKYALSVKGVKNILGRGRCRLHFECSMGVALHLSRKRQLCFYESALSAKEMG